MPQQPPTSSWDDTSVYVAVRVTDDDVTGVSDAKYAEAVAELGDYGLWLTDQITCYLTYKGMTSTIRVEALGRYGAEWDGDGYEGWVDWARWHSQDLTARTVSMQFPIQATAIS